LLILLFFLHHVEAGIGYVQYSPFLIRISQSTVL